MTNTENEQGTMFSTALPEQRPTVTRVKEFQSEKDFLFKIALIGDANVGKTSLLTRFCDGFYKDRYNTTIGVDFRLINLQTENGTARLQLMDTAGQERYRAITASHFRGCQGFIFVYDISLQKTFKNLQGWIDTALSENNKATINMLIGNKSDLEDKRQVSMQEGEDLAKLRKMFFFEASAQNANNVDLAFEMYAYKLIEFYNKNKDLYNELTNQENIEIKGMDISTEREKKKKGCC